jgi:Ca2+-binding EF-hand superfamily protein
MISRRSMLCAVTATMFVGRSVAFAKPRSTAIQMFDTDNDGTIDLEEAKKAALALFERLDRDHDGTLDRRELAGRLSAQELAAANPDNDGTLDKGEYLALVERRFLAANTDNDGTLDAKELATKAGQSLLRLLK